MCGVVNVTYFDKLFYDHNLCNFYRLFCNGFPISVLCAVKVAPHKHTTHSHRQTIIIMLIVDRSGNKMKLNYLHGSWRAPFAFYDSANMPHSYLFNILFNTRSNNLCLAVTFWGRRQTGTQGLTVMFQRDTDTYSTKIQIHREKRL